MNRGRLAIPLAAAGIALLLQRAEFADSAVTGLDRPPVFTWSCAGLELVAVDRNRLLEALARWLPIARGLVGGLALAAGAALARSWATGSLARVGWALGFGLALFLALDPGLLRFVAERSAIGAETRLDVTHALRGWGAGLLVWAALLFSTGRRGADRDPREAGESTAGPAVQEARPWLWLALAGLALAAVGELLSRWALFGEPLTNDGRAYLFQARLFAGGQMTLAGSPLDAFFPARQIYVGERVFAKYPPGHALWLTPGVWLGWPALMTRLGQLLTPALGFFVARGLGARRPLTVALWATASPMVVAIGVTHLSHTSSLPLALAATAATFAGLEAAGRNQPRRALTFATLAGLALSACVLVRPGTGVVLALWLVAISLSRRGVRAIPSIGVGLLACLPAVAFFAAFNHATTGSWLDTAYALYARELSPNDRWGLVNSATALPNTLYNLTRLDVWWLGLAPGLVWMAMGVRGSWRQALERAGLPLGLVAFYAFLKFHGVPWAGPLYWVEAIVPLAVLAVAGCEEFGRRQRTPGGENLVLRVVAVAGLLVGSWLVVTQLRAAEREASARRAPWTALEQAVGSEERAIVFVRLPREIDRKRFHLTRPIGEPRLWAARSLGGDDLALARSLGVDRAFRFDPSSGWLSELELPGPASNAGAGALDSSPQGQPEGLPGRDGDR